MNFKLAVVALVFSVALSNGAVLPFEEDALFDMVQSFLIEPDNFATSALGMTRNKRDTNYDRDFNLGALGARVQIKYIDPSNKLKGGEALITIENLKQYIPQARSTKVVLGIKFNSGVSLRDGLFTMSVDYELHHSNVEKGTLKVVRTNDGGLWKTEVSVVSTNNAAVKLIPVFAINLKSDRMTTAEGTYTCEHGNDYKFTVDRTPGKKIHAVVKGNGRVYTVDGVLDQAEKNVQINIDANGQKFVIDMDVNDTGAEYQFVANVNLGASGSYKVEMNGEKSMTGGSMKILYNGRDFLSAKSKGKIEGSNFKYELRYSGVGIGEGKLRLSFTEGPKRELMLQYLPKSGLDLSVQVTRDLKADQSRHLHAILKRGGEVYLEYQNDIVPTLSDAAYEVKADSQFDINSKSLLYPIFCTYGCFNTRTMHAKVFVDKNTPYKFSVDVKLTKDSETVLTIDMNTRNNPYVMKVFAPRILPKILPTGRDSIEFEADHNPGKYLKIKSNTNILKSFVIENMGNNMRRVELNGKELVQAGFTKGDNSITQTTTLPDGRSLTTTLSWESENLKKNTVTIKLDGTERQLDGVISWDVTNPEAAVVKIDGKGKNARWGNYNLHRDLKLSSVGGKLSAELTGNSSFDTAPWPSPVKTDIRMMVDTISKDYSFVINKNIAGRTYGATLQNGKLSINL